MPLEELKLIWTKAVDLLSSPDDSIVPCPGFQSEFAVASAQDPAKPHIVIPLASGEVRCCGCPQYDRLSICSHTVAVVEKKSILWKFLLGIPKTGINLTSLKQQIKACQMGEGKKGRELLGSRGQKSKVKIHYLQILLIAFILSLQTLSNQDRPWCNQHPSCPQLYNLWCLQQCLWQLCNSQT